METFNSDPKPGRLILPLVLIGMIATTYTFINRVADNNNLEIIEESVQEEVVEEVVEETSTTSSTTTTLPENYIGYLEEITAEKLQAIELGKQVLEANQNWDDKSVTYQEAKQEFADFIEDERDYSDSENARLDLLKENLNLALRSLTNREVDVLKMRFGMDDGIKRTLEEVGDTYQVTRERIRQIEAKAIRKLLNTIGEHNIKIAA